MLQDEVTLKTIKDEELEKKRMKHEDEDDGETADASNTVFIDNLPNDEFEIRRMLKEVKKHIKQLEK